MNDFDSMLSSLNEATLDILKLSPKEQKEIIKGNSIQGVDLIWAHGDPLACCLAVNASFLYGFNASYPACEKCKSVKQHKVYFLDNPYQNYIHKDFLAVVKDTYEYNGKIKYITIRDLMTREQCKEAGITYFELEQILEFAEEIQAYAENVILIPKYDCLDRIPGKYMLGYSTPSSFGGTPMPMQAFKGRRVHLLGGPPNKQIGIINKFPEEVVSVDGNYLHRIASKGEVWLGDGKSHTSLRSLVINDLNIYENKIRPQNIMYICLTISLGMLANYFNVRSLGLIDAE